MASIIILSLAILPMAGMFDMGLRTATTGSNYDKGRTLANLKMEEAKSLPFDTVRDNFPEPAGTTTTYDGSGYYQSGWKTVYGSCEPPTSRISSTWSRSSTWRSRPGTRDSTRLTLPQYSESPTRVLRNQSDQDKGNRPVPQRQRPYTTYGLVTR